MRQIVREDFLSEQEKEELRVRQGIPARLIDPKLQIFNDVILIRWDMPKITGNTTSTYALRTSWNNVRKSNDLKEGDLVQLWSFRVGQQACEDASSSTATNKGQLCFALVLLRGDKTNSWSCDCFCFCFFFFFVLKFYSLLSRRFQLCIHIFFLKLSIMYIGAWMS